MLATVTPSAFECDGTSEGLGNLWARRSRQHYGFEVYLARAVLAHGTLKLNLREKLTEKNGRGGRKGMVGEPDREPR